VLWENGIELELLVGEKSVIYEVHGLKAKNGLGIHVCHSTITMLSYSVNDVDK